MIASKSHIYPQNRQTFWRPYWKWRATIKFRYRKWTRHTYIYLKTKFHQNRSIFRFLRPFWIKNGRRGIKCQHRKWTCYTYIYLKTKFPRNRSIFRFLWGFERRPFWNGDHFENSESPLHIFEWWPMFVQIFIKIVSSISE